MRINSIDPISGSGNKVSSYGQTTNVQKSVAPNFRAISFRGGNQGDVLHVIAELPPYVKSGGVATVAQDYKSLNNLGNGNAGKTAMVIPYYNGQIKYAPDGETITAVDVLRVPNNLPEGHPLKGKEGRPFFTNQDLDKNSIESILKDSKKYTLLEDVASKDMAWGIEEKSPIKLFRVPETNHYMVFTEATASMPKPYAGGGYSTTKEVLAHSWGGDSYAKFDKAVVELMPDISKNIPGYDPKTVICSDAHAAYVSHWMAVKNAAGEEFFRGKNPTQVGHNLGDGYIAATSPRNMLVNLGATKQDIEKLLSSKEYHEALLRNEEDKFLSKFVESLLTKGKQSVSAIDVPIYYAQKGFLPMFTTVSEGYHEALLANEELSPKYIEIFQQLSEQGRFKGITNPLNDPNVSAFKQLGLPGYKADVTLKLANGKEEVIKGFEVFDKARYEKEGLNYVREVKRNNKINLLKRLSHDLDGAQLVADGGKLMEKGSGAGLVRAGLPGRSLKLLGEIDGQYIQRLTKGEDIKLAVSWGRGDFQKGLDTVLDSFYKFVKKTGDKDTVLLLGGELDPRNPESQVIKDKIKELMSLPETKGRFVFFDGFAPGLPFASAADVSILPSRFAPCELTDFEAKKMLSTTIVTNCQGLGQKNFDPDIEAEKAIADGFKTKHEYFTKEAECLRDGVASPEAKSKFEKIKQKLFETEKIKLQNRGANLTDEEIFAKIAKTDAYNDALRELRDSIISDEVAECMDRALHKYRNGETAEAMMKNLVNIETSWETNGWLSKTKQSSAELYRKYMIEAQSTNIEKSETLLDKMQQAFRETLTDVEKSGKKSSSKGKIIAYSCAAAVAVALGVLGIQHAKNKQPKEEEHLSSIA